MFDKLFSVADEARGAGFHIFYRWANIIYIAILVIMGVRFPASTSRIITALIIAAVYTFLLTVFFSRVNRLLIKYPFLLVFDIAYCAFLTGFTNGWRSPFWLHLMSPVLLGAFWFKLKGAVLSAATLSFFHTVALHLNGYTLAYMLKTHWLESLLGDYFSFFLVGIFFAYPATLVEILKERNIALEKLKERLSETNQKLLALQEVNAIILAEKELNEVLNVILEAVADELKYDRVILGFVDEKKMPSLITLLMV